MPLRFEPLRAPPRGSTNISHFPRMRTPRAPPAPPPPNQDPVANASGPDQPVNLGDQVELNGSGSRDPDDDPLTYTWSASTDNPGLVGFDPQDRNISFSLSVPGTYVFTLTVSDDKNNSSSTNVTVVVLGNNNTRPIADILLPDGSVFREIDEIRLDGSGSTDPDGDTLSYLWEIENSDTTVVDLDNQAIQPLFRPPVSGI